MFITLKLAWRNIWRHRRRSLLTFAAVAFAATVLEFFVSLQLSSYDAAIEGSVRMFTGHVQLQAKGYLERPQMRRALDDIESIRALAESEPLVESATSRAYAFSLISSTDRTYGVQVSGVDPLHEQQVSSIPGQIRQGSFFEQRDEQGCIIGETLARNLQVGIGDELTFLGQAKDGSLAATVLPLTGIFETGSKDLDRRLAILPLRTFQETFFMGDSGHAVVLRVGDITAVEKTQQLLKSKTDSSNVSVLRWDQVIPGLKEAIELDMASGILFHFCLVLVVVFSIVNTFLMSVLERTKEFGVMLAIGNSPWALARLVLLECFILTSIGLFIGGYIGWGVVSYFGTHGFSVPGMEEVAKLWNMPSEVHTKMSPQVLLRGPLVLFVVTMLAAIYPATKIFKLKPTEAIRTGE